MRNTPAEDIDLTSLGLIHDLQSPLSAAAGAFRVLETLLGQGDHDTRFFRDTVRTGLRNASAIVREWHALLAQAHAREPAQTIDLRPVVDQLCADLALREVVTVERLPRAHVQPEKIRLVLRNLLDNARRYRRPDVPERITVGSVWHPDHHCIFVRDNGCGIPRKHHAALFEPFCRIPRAGPSDHPPGLGVGLHLVKRIVRQHGGQVWLSSRARRGATFYFTLPKRRPE